MSDFKKYQYQDSLSRRNKLARLIWNFVFFVSFRSNPRWALNGWRIFLLRLFGAKIGTGCKVSPSCFVWAPWNLSMGDFSVLGDGVDCYTMARINIGSKVAISQRVFLCTGSHDITSLKRPLITKSINIEDHVWVCAESFVGPGVTLGNGAVIAARSVVVKSVDTHAIVAGNPAVFLKRRLLKDD